MNRRGFLRGLLAAPLIPVAAPVITETAPLAYVGGISGSAMIGPGVINASDIIVNDIITTGFLVPPQIAEQIAQVVK